ncbi:endo-1,3(4)-beta-glucanase, partial [Candidatus Marinimicrobia bacterium]|nr:endo-1,3(4)-beta-glucanase [Candidatus Neomarinimicrobiota bacterium]
MTTFSTGNIISVGSGSYTTIFPGVDEAGRNSYPSGSPQVTGPASYKKIPTNDWWSKVVKENHADNLFNYPLALKTVNEGLVASYIPWGVYDDQEPIINGIANHNVSESKVYDFSDWTVTLDWSDENNFFRVTTGIGMPFLYFNKNSESLAQVKVNLGSVTVIGERIIIEDARNGADFIIYAPTGSVWNQNGMIYTSDLNGQNYWSMVMLPDVNNDLIELSEEYSQFAYVFPQNTYVEWDFNESNSILTTEFVIDVDIKEGSHSKILQGILPHQWNNLAIDSDL